MDKYIVRAGQYKERMEAEDQLNTIAQVWVYANGQAEALKKAIKKITRESNGKIIENDIEYLEAIKIKQ